MESKAFRWYFSEDSKGFHFHSRVLVASFIFFFFIILFNFLFLYIQWRCRRRSSARAEAVFRSQSYAARTLQPADSHGLEAAIIDSFPIFLYGSEASTDGENTLVKETECSICLGAFQKEEKVKVLPRCSHGYHAECVAEWLKTQSTCPLCRASFRDHQPLDESSLP